MKVVIATCFESNEERVSFLYDACVSRAYDVKAFTSDFSHIRKEKRSSIPDRFEAIATEPYRRNLSFQRMISHWIFSKKLFARIEAEDPDLIWLMIPANSLVREARSYKKRYPDKKIIIDIIDMWPESLPVRINKDLFPLNAWKDLRSRNLGCADALVSECDLYKNILSNEYDGPITTIHWARDSEAVKTKTDIPDDKLSLVYIGSINNIIDTEKIAATIKEIDMPVRLHVIGEGENTVTFLNSMREVSEVIYHGPIRDEKKKTEIFGQCHAGINIYRDGLYIGLTVKCIDYFEHGLPIINNIKGDTWSFVEKYNAGINISDHTVIRGRDLIGMRDDNAGIYELFEDNLTKRVFTEKCLRIIDEVNK